MTNNELAIGAFIRGSAPFRGRRGARRRCFAPLVHGRHGAGLSDRSVAEIVKAPRRPGRLRSAGVRRPQPALRLRHHRRPPGRQSRRRRGPLRPPRRCGGPALPPGRRRAEQSGRQARRLSDQPSSHACRVAVALSPCLGAVGAPHQSRASTRRAINVEQGLSSGRLISPPARR
jgi:hypothetical protein